MSQQYFQQQQQQGFLFNESSGTNNNLNFNINQQQEEFDVTKVITKERDFSHSVISNDVSKNKRKEIIKYIYLLLKKYVIRK